VALSTYRRIQISEKFDFLLGIKSLSPMLIAICSNSKDEHVVLSRCYDCNLSCFCDDL